MFGHAGGAASLGAPTWLLAYGAAACAVLVALALRSRIRDSYAADEPVPSEGGAGGTAAWRTARAVWSAIGRVLGPGLLAVVVVAAFVGPDAEVVNFAPSVVLGVWWIGLPLACVVLGDVMAWLEPFGLAARRPGNEGPSDGPRWTAPVLLAAAAWWVLVYPGASSPRVLGAVLLPYALVATAGGWRWGRGWLRHGEAFGALSSQLAALRRPWSASRSADGPGAAGSGVGPAGLVTVWLGAAVFDVFAGSRAWVELEGSVAAWARTAVATGTLAGTMVLAGVVVAGTVKLADRASAAGPVAQPGARRAATGAVLASTAGVFLAHGLTLLLVDGQRALAHASDPFGRGWDVFGTRGLLTDYSPLTPGIVGTMQLALVVGAHVAGVVAAAARLRAGVRAGDIAAPAAWRTLWTIALVVALVVTASVTVLTTDLE